MESEEIFDMFWFNPSASFRNPGSTARVLHAMIASLGG
jgi:hypothetical protein